MYTNMISKRKYDLLNQQIVFLVRDGRLELPTSCSQSRRATNCANPGYLVLWLFRRCSQSRRATNCATPRYLLFISLVGSFCRVWFLIPKTRVKIRVRASALTHLFYQFAPQSQGGFCHSASARQTLMPARATANTNQNIHMTRG